MSEHPFGYFLLFWWFLSETFTRSWWRVSHVTSVTNRKEGKQDFCLLHLNSNKMKWSALWWKSEGTLNNINGSVEVPISQCQTGNGEQMLWKISECWLRLWFYLLSKTYEMKTPSRDIILTLPVLLSWKQTVFAMHVFHTQGIHQLCPGCVTVTFVWQDLEPRRQEPKD